MVNVLYTSWHWWCSQSTHAAAQITSPILCRLTTVIRHGLVSTDYRIRQQLDVVHQRNLWKILGITWKDRVTNREVLSRTGQRRLQDIVTERRLRMAGHIIRMPPGRPANHAMSWTPRGSGFKEDLVDRGVDWNSVRAVSKGILSDISLICQLNCYQKISSPICLQRCVVTCIKMLKLNSYGKCWKKICQSRGYTVWSAAGRLQMM